MIDPKFLRREAAAEYLRSRYGFTTARTLSKLASVGGGPVFHKIGAVVVYDPQDLDAWAQGRMSGPLQSAADTQPVAA